MRPLFFLVLAAPLVASCTPYIPERLDFGVSALTPKGDIPSRVRRVQCLRPGRQSRPLASQMCATSYEPRSWSPPPTLTPASW